jgi:hypothetical protein
VASLRRRESPPRCLDDLRQHALPRAVGRQHGPPPTPADRM